MITSKATRCQRWCWAWVTRFPHSLASEIPALDYTTEEITRALGALCTLGYIELEWGGVRGARGYVARVPFVVEAPPWSK